MRHQQSCSPAAALTFVSSHCVRRHEIKQISDTANDIPSIFTTSELFTQKWFGETSSIKHIVTEGRFAFQEITTNRSADVTSPYGYLRAPWNLNPSKYVTRYHQMCGVKETALLHMELETFDQGTLKLVDLQVSSFFSLLPSLVRGLTFSLPCSGPRALAITS